MQQKQYFMQKNKKKERKNTYVGERLCFCMQVTSTNLGLCAKAPGCFYKIHKTGKTGQSISPYHSLSEKKVKKCVINLGIFIFTVHARVQLLPGFSLFLCFPNIWTPYCLNFVTNSMLLRQCVWIWFSRT